MLFRRASVRYGRTPPSETPFHKASQVWDERIGSARVQARNWRLIAFGNLFLSATLVGVIIWQAARGSVTPWVVEIDKLGQAQAISPAVADYRPTDPQIAWHLARFIENVRAIPADPVIVRQNWLAAYDFVTDKGATALNDYARANDPFTKVGKTPGRGRDLERDPGLERQLPCRLGRAPLSRMRASRRPNAGPPSCRSCSTPRTTPSGCARTHSASLSTPSTGRRSSADALTSAAGWY